VLPSDVRQFWDAKHEIVAVDLDKVVSGDGRRVDVVFTERTDEVLKEMEGGAKLD
jgi:hypothetical protein